MSSTLHQNTKLFHNEIQKPNTFLMSRYCVNYKKRTFAKECKQKFHQLFEGGRCSGAVGHE